MDDGRETTEVLNDLVRVNRDRVEGYKTAMASLKPTDIDLQTMFTNMADHSTQHSKQLTEEIARLGGKPVTESSQPGRIYHAWMKIRAALNPHDRRSVVSMCEFGEDAALKAYDAALETENLPSGVKELIAEQRSDLEKAHDVVKRYRDMQDAVSK
jgi:uncharacterized protein (TIGR02284 family)